MVVCYLDTSAILKRYRTEKGTRVVTELYRSNDEFLVTSHFACLEFESVASRALRGRLLTKAVYDSMLDAFAADLDNCLHLLPVRSSVINEAIEATRQHSVRAPDAIHLATAEAAKRDAREDFVFVASDKELLSAAGMSGMETLNREADDAMEKLRGMRK